MRSIANFQCVGNKYRLPEEVEAFSNLMEGDEVKLVFEPDNKHDPKAIKVMGWDGYKEEWSLHLGYVPKSENEYIGEVIANAEEDYGEALVMRYYSGTVFVISLP